ncbi:phage protein NinX family protein [Enterobacter kobei]|uniref:phage protein NinX family protein n=1 Tax=Enterobacter kobei TaxID=208224 RepID=UPI003D6FA7A8
MGDDQIAWTKENGDQIITDKVPYTKNGVHDYCNNPADAWPIIQANGICIGYDGISWDASCHLHDIGQINDWKNHPEKPLRMAMIVYLLIQESKHA